MLRLPLAAPGLPRPAATVAVLCTSIGSTIFDGAAEGPLFGEIVPHLQDFFVSLGMSKGAALEAGFTVGLVFCVLFVRAMYALGVRGMPASPAAGRGRSPSRWSRSSSPTSWRTTSRCSPTTASRCGRSRRIRWATAGLSGGAGATIDYGVVSATAIWYVQVLALVVGHVCGLVLAHDRALALYGSAKAAVRSQIIMLVVMVGFTCLGLWLLSVSNA